MSKRIITTDIYNSRTFMELPVEVRDLYTYLLLNADNDGVVEAYSVMNMIKADATSLRLLDEAGFVKVFNEEQMICVCNHERGAWNG